MERLDSQYGGVMPSAGRFWHVLFPTILPAALAMALFLLAVFGVILPIFKTTILDAKYELIRETTLVAVSILDDFDRDHRNGLVTLDEAQDRAREAIRYLRYGPEMKDYFWIITDEPRVVLNPYRTDLEGQEVGNYTDVDGVPFFQEFVREAKEEGEGFVRYRWQWKDDATRIEPKISYVRAFEPWGWIIGTGVYLGDAHEEIRKTSARLRLICIVVAVLMVLLTGSLVWRGISVELRGRRAAQALQQSEERFRSLTESTSDWIWEIDANGRFVYSSPRVQDLFGYSSEEVLGRTPFDFIVPEQEQEMRAAYEKTMRSKTPIHGLESRIVCKNGGECVVETNAVPAFDSAHRLLGYRGISRDITGRRQAEEEARFQEQQLIQADKMTSLGLLVSGVAHEINNPNHFILGNAQSLQGLWEGAVPVLERYYQEHGDFRMGGLNFSKARQFLPDLIRGIQEGAGRIKVIVQELRDYARQEPTYLKEKVNMNGVVESATILMSNMIKKRTNHFSVYYDEALPEVLGNFQRLEQVVINLIQNGCEALDNPENGLTVRTEYDPQKALISVSVEDEGCGITPEHLSHVTDPFFTTKRDSGGTGLGLSVSSGIVKEHGGTLRFVSTLGQGTISIIELPCPE